MPDRITQILEKLTLMHLEPIEAVDLYCGAGGTSSGLVKACEDAGRKVRLIAINHWDVAIDTHSTNHPGAQHLCTNIDNLDPRKVVPGGYLHILVASPECTHHSIARGGRPVNDQLRASAWHILRWAEALYIENILIENVKEFRDWGPVGKDGKPMKRLKGKLFLQFLESLRALGYKVEWRILNAANYGDATTRERLFIMARRKKKSISWPEPTHAPASQVSGKQAEMYGHGKLKPWVPAREIIDWELPGEDIFTRKKPLADNTLRRIFAGLEKFGGEAAKPFLVILRGTGSTRDIDRPMPAITAQGNHVALCEPFMLGQQSGAAPRSVEKPVPTIATGGAISVIEPYLVNMKGGSDACSVELPTPAQTTKSHQALCEPYVVPFDHGNGSETGARSVEQPLSTVVTKQRHALCEPYIVGAGGPTRAGEPQTVEKPLGTVLTRNTKAVIQPFMVAAGGPVGQGRRPKSTDEPLGTVLTENHRALIEPFIVPQFSEQGPRSVDKPLGTITTTSRGVGLAEPYIVSVNHGNQEGNGDERRVHDIKKPLPAVTTKNGYALVETQVAPDPYLTKFYGSAKSAQSVEEPLDTVTTKDRFGLVQPVVDGMKLEIRFRMLQPHELAAAQSFDPDYHFAGNKSEITKQIGNAVPVNTARALIAELLK